MGLDDDRVTRMATERIVNLIVLVGVYGFVAGGCWSCYVLWCRWHLTNWMSFLYSHVDWGAPWKAGGNCWEKATTGLCINYKPSRDSAWRSDRRHWDDSRSTFDQMAVIPLKASNTVLSSSNNHARMVGKTHALSILRCVSNLDPEDKCWYQEHHSPVLGRDKYFTCSLLDLPELFEATSRPTNPISWQFSKLTII